MAQQDALPSPSQNAGRYSQSGFGAYLTQFLKAPTAVASPFPSSQGMVHRLLGGLPWDEIRLLVEFGPGTGAFTRYSLQHMRPDARLLAIDTEAGFIEHLQRSIGDPRLVGLTGSARDVTRFVKEQGADRVQCVVSGLPFSTLDEEEREAIIRQSAALLGDTGHFLAYQVRRTIEPHLKAAFRTVSRRRYWLNLPPCHLYHATFGASAKSLKDKSAVHA